MTRTADLSIWQGATSPSISAALKYRAESGAWTPIDLTDATAVDFVLILDGRALDQAAVDAEAVIVSAADGTVRYDLAAGDTDRAGWYGALWRIRWTSGRVEYVPGDQTKVVEIRKVVA